MTKDEALKMAMDNAYSIMQCQNVPSAVAIYNACKEALEQPAQEYLTRAQQVIRANNKALEQPEGKEFFERGKEIARWADKQAQEPDEIDKWIEENLPLAKD